MTRQQEEKIIVTVCALGMVVILILAAFGVGK